MDRVNLLAALLSLVRITADHYTGCLALLLMHHTGSYVDSTSGIVWNLYNHADPAGYHPPGPAVWSGAKGGFIGQVGKAA